MDQLIMSGQMGLISKEMSKIARLMIISVSMNAMISFIQAQLETTVLMEKEPSKPRMTATNLPDSSKMGKEKMESLHGSSLRKVIYP